MLKTWLFTIILSFCATHVQQRSLPGWLVGIWINPANNVYEEWIKDRDELQGRSFRLVNGDSTVSETIRILWRGDQMVYIPTVIDQNEGKPIEFQMKESSEYTIAFENMNHDFPQNIRYQLIHQDSLVATISGMRGEQNVTIVFPMKRVKN